MGWVRRASCGVRGCSGVLSGTEVGVGDVQSHGGGDCQALDFSNSLTDKGVGDEGAREAGADVEDMREMMKRGCGFLLDSILFYCFLALSLFHCSNSAINCGAWTSAAVSQELSLMGYPFHLIRYCSLCPHFLLSMTFSTSYSGSPLIRFGGGWVKFGLCSSISLYGVRRFAWNTLCIFHCQGISTR